MPSSRSATTLVLPPKGRGVTAHLWLYAALREAILTGRLRSGARLPATRDLASQVGVARGTVVRAFQQLTAEGYTTGTMGSGTFVSNTLPDDLLSVRGARPSVVKSVRPTAPTRERRLSRFARRVEEFPAISHRPMRAFRANQPAIDLFPTALWARVAARRLRSATARHLIGCPPLGFPPLQEVIADYLRTARAVRCESQQIVVVSGVQEALDIAARLTLDPGDIASMEDPGYLGARLVFEGAGAKVERVGIDDEGMRIPTGRAADARLVYVTTAHQYPLGVSMSLARRLTLLEWARTHDALIFEDDYDSEYRYAGQPLPSLQGLDSRGAVLLAGSFSKVLFPSLRMGYLVVPHDLLERVAALKSVTHRHAPVLDQAILADFMGEGHFGRHVRRMREIYAERLSVLRASATARLSGLLEVSDIDAGLQTVGWLPNGVGADDVVREAGARDVEVVSLSRMTRRPLPREGLQLGFAAVDSREIRRGVEVLRQVLESLARTNRR